MTTNKQSQEEIDLSKGIENSFKSEKYRDDLEIAIALSIKEGNETKEKQEIFVGSSFENDLEMAINNSLLDTHKETFGMLDASCSSDDNSDDIQLALLNSLDGFATAKTTNNDEDEQDIYEKEFEARPNIDSDVAKNEAKSVDSPSVVPNRPCFDAAYAYKEQSDILAACEKSLIELGKYQDNNKAKNDLDLIMNYILDTDNSNNGDELMQVLENHYKESVKTGYDESRDQGSSSNLYNGYEPIQVPQHGYEDAYEEYTETVTGKIFHNEPISLLAAGNTEINVSWVQSIFESLTNTLCIIVAKAASIIDNVLTVIEQYNIIDVQFFRNLLNGKFDIKEAIKFGSGLLKKVVSLVKLLNQIKSMDLKSLDFTEIAVMCKNIGLITQAV